MYNFFYFKILSKKLFVKKLVLAFCLVLLTIHISSGQETLFEKLKNDKELLAYKQCQKIVQEKMRSGYFKVPSNFAVLGYKDGKPLPPDSLKVVLKKEGMQNAEEMIDLMAKQQNHLMAFFAAHPEIKKLKPDEQRELFMKLLAF
jgi:hypothetical protein